MKAKKVITIHVKNDVEKEEFLRELQKMSPPAFIYVHGKLNSFKINIQGTKRDIKETVGMISTIHGRVRAKLYPNRRGLYRYNVRELTEGIPTTALTTALDILGERFELDPSGSTITTSLPWQEMEGLVGRMRRMMGHVAQTTTKQIREVVLPVAAVFDADPMDVIDTLVDLGMAEWKGEKFKYELVRNKKQALKALLDEDRFKYELEKMRMGAKHEDRDPEEGREHD